MVRNWIHARSPAGASSSPVRFNIGAALRSEVFFALAPDRRASGDWASDVDCSTVSEPP